MNIGRYIGTSATTDTDISVLPILVIIGRYSISADTDMPTLVKYIQNSSSPKENCLNVYERDISKLIQNTLCESSYKIESEKLSQCTWPCNEIIYDMMVSQAEWPQDSMVKDFAERYILSLPCDSPVKWYHHKLYELHGERFPTKYICNETKWPEYKLQTDENVFDVAKAFDFIFGTPLEGDNSTQTNNATFNIENATYKISFPPPHVGKTLLQTEYKWIKRYFYRLNIYFSEPTIESHKQVISFSFTDLMSSVGGVLGLWVGVSMVTVIEMLVFVAKICKPVARVESSGAKGENKQVVK